MESSTERAVAAAVAVARAQGVRVAEPVVVRDLTNVLVRLDPAPIVARVPITLARLRPPSWFDEEARLVAVLAAQGAPVAPLTAEVDPGPHSEDGFRITLFRWIDHDPERLDGAAAGRALRELHAALDGYPGRALPSCDRLDEVRGVLAQLDETDEIAELRAFADRLEPLDGRPLHGDAHLSNVLWSPDGPLWNDFENACRGPVEYDLACLRFRGLPAAAEATEGYGDHGDVEIAMPYLALALAAWTQLVVERSTEGAHHGEARRRIERALAYAREM